MVHVLPLHHIIALGNNSDALMANFRHHPCDDGHFPSSQVHPAVHHRSALPYFTVLYNDDVSPSSQLAAHHQAITSSWATTAYAHRRK
jgi:hypothetical protein